MSQPCPWALRLRGLCQHFVPPGIFSKPSHAKMSYPAAQLSSSLPLLLICDNIRDPGNLGTILRSAAAAGCGTVLLTKGKSLSRGRRSAGVIWGWDGG